MRKFIVTTEKEYMTSATQEIASMFTDFNSAPHPPQLELIELSIVKSIEESGIEYRMKCLLIKETNTLIINVADKKGWHTALNIQEIDIEVLDPRQDIYAMDNEE